MFCVLSFTPAFKTPFISFYSKIPAYGNCDKKREILKCFIKLGI